MAVLEASWRPSWAILAPSGAGKPLATTSGRVFRVAGGTCRSPLGELFWKRTKTKNRKRLARQAPLLMNQQGAADRRRLRRITAAPCLFGNADVAESWARAWPSYRTMSSPSRFGKLSGNTWGRMNMNRKRKRKRKSRRMRVVRSLLGHPWGLLGASWGPLRGLLEASWGPPWASWGPLGASWGSLWPS